MKIVNVLAMLVAVTTLIGCDQSDDTLISQAKVSVAKFIENNRSDLLTCQKSNDQMAQRERIKSLDFSYRADGKCLEQIYNSQHLSLNSLVVKGGVVCGNVAGVNSFGDKITLPFIYGTDLYSKHDGRFAVVLKNTSLMRKFQPDIARQINQENNKLLSKFCL